jgi:hypothetical protein
MDIASSPATSTTRRAARSRIRRCDTHTFVSEIFADDLHAQRVLSVANGVVGVIHAAALSIHAIGHGLAQAEGLSSRHAIKQVDRLLSNGGFDVWSLFAPWAEFVLAQRTEIIVALDWTEFDKDDHATIALYLVTTHGRATPLLWKTHRKSELLDNRNAWEDELLGRFREIVPIGIRITLLADRAFGDQLLYESLADMDIDYVIRFRGCIHVESAPADGGKQKPATDWVPANGRPKMLKNARVTHKRTEVPAVVLVHAPRMKEPWCLAASRNDLTSSEVVKLYGRRFTIEETFRDGKDLRFGMGLSSTHIGKTERRDRLLFLGAMAQALLTLLGAASEETGLDRLMKANTVKKRTHSLFRQGIYWYGAIPNMREDRFNLLMNAFGRLVMTHAVFTRALGVI